MKILIEALKLLTVLSIASYALLAALSLYKGKKRKQEISASIKENELKQQRKLIAQQSPRVEEALVELHDFNATGVETVMAIIEGRGLSQAESKFKVIESNMWESEKESIEELHLTPVEIRLIR